MGILGFLLGLGCLVVIAWAVTLLGHAVFDRKRRQPDRPQEQPSPQPTEFREHRTSQPTTIVPSVPSRKVVTLRQRRCGNSND